MNFPRFPPSGHPFVIGHRGAAGHALENSLSAFRLAASREGPGRCDGVELDVHATADGGFVVHHDPALGTGELIASLPLSRVRAMRLADGTPVPTLIEALEVLNGLDVFVEAKSVPRQTGRALLAALRACRGTIHVHSFDHRIIARLRHLDARLSLGVLSASYPIDPVRQVNEAGAGTLWQEASLIDEALVQTCRREGVAIIAWTVNDAPEALRLGRLGVDGLCGDWPERLGIAGSAD